MAQSVGLGLLIFDGSLTAKNLSLEIHFQRRFRGIAKVFTEDVRHVQRAFIYIKFSSEILLSSQAIMELVHQKLAGAIEASVEKVRWHQPQISHYRFDSDWWK